jgi:hypothetical protein
LYELATEPRTSSEPDVPRVASLLLVLSHTHVTNITSEIFMGETHFIIYHPSTGSITVFRDKTILSVRECELLPDGAGKYGLRIVEADGKLVEFGSPTPPQPDTDSVRAAVQSFFEENDCE